jgi:hypothetical protein
MFNGQSALLAARVVAGDRAAAGRTALPVARTARRGLRAMLAARRPARRAAVRAARVASPR